MGSCSIDTDTYFCTHKLRMKKVILVFLTLLYGVMSSGITLNLHYCMGRLTNVEWGSVSTCASCGQKKMASHCCTDKTQYVKLTVDQNVNDVSAVKLMPAVTELFPMLFCDFISLGTENTGWISAVFDSPLEQTGVPLFVHHCTYLI